MQLILAVPVELLSFNAEVSYNKVILSWETSTETNSDGFSIERAEENSSFSEIGFVDAAGNSTSANTYKFVDELFISGKYFYRLRQVNFDGTFEFSPEIEVTINKSGGLYTISKLSQSI